MLEVFGYLFICETLWLIGLFFGWWIEGFLVKNGKIVPDEYSAFYTLILSVIWSFLWFVISLITVGFKLLG